MVDRLTGGDCARLVAHADGSAVDLDVAAAYQWYGNEEPGLGLGFLDQLLANGEVSSGLSQLVR